MNSEIPADLWLGRYYLNCNCKTTNVWQSNELISVKYTGNIYCFFYVQLLYIHCLLLVFQLLLSDLHSLLALVKTFHFFYQSVHSYHMVLFFNWSSSASKLIEFCYLVRKSFSELQWIRNSRIRNDKPFLYFTFLNLYIRK